MSIGVVSTNDSLLLFMTRNPVATFLKSSSTPVGLIPMAFLTPDVEEIAQGGNFFAMFVKLEVI